MIEGLIIAMALLAGAVCAVVWAKRARQRRLSEVAAQAEKHRQQAELDVRQVREQAERDVAEQATQAQRTVEQEQLVFAEEQRRVESLLQRKSKRIEQREAQLEQREGEVDRRYRELRELRRQTKDIRDAARERREARTRALEERAAETAAEVAQSMADRMVEEVRSECADRLRNLDSGAEEFNREAKRVMSIIMQRYTGHCVRERGAMTMQLPQGAWDKLQKDNAELLSKLSESTDVGLVPSDDQLSLRLESSDGVARETCRRVLTRALGEPVRNVDQLIEATQTALERELHAQGKDAFAQLGLPPADPEIVDLVGRLNYRTSYTQNQWRHAIEAGHLAGMMAQELGLAGELARRGALLHDIGKALTPQVEGSHALIGAEIARRTGEDERVANAIGYHHGEEPCGSAFSPLVAAADALSGGRPGARREMAESYGDRIGDLERLAGAFPGVVAVHAVQAGRELRIIVDHGRVGETELAELSSEIARKISDEVTFPGQIRVTVIREFCATEYAT
ncbi:MAG: DUF3552 domain-containing protein [Deltaproteobacteria bacterium]|nr:DUF3552 domain-containing protein [Deltaproteobacteria bacterium]